MGCARNPSMTYQDAFLRSSQHLRDSLNLQVKALLCIRQSTRHFLSCLAALLHRCNCMDHLLADLSTSSLKHMSWKTLQHASQYIRCKERLKTICSCSGIWGWRLWSTSLALLPGQWLSPATSPDKGHAIQHLRWDHWHVIFAAVLCSVSKCMQCAQSDRSRGMCPAIAG